jgi:cysteine desulfurase/selenocysteine lyase
MRRFGVSGTTRASFYFYNTLEEIDRMIEILHTAVRFFSPKEKRSPVRALS